MMEDPPPHRGAEAPEFAAHGAAGASGQRMGRAVDAARLGLYDADLLAGTLYWSPQMLAILGLPSDTAPPPPEAMPFAVHPEDAERARRAFRCALDPAGDGRIEDEHRIVRPDGNVRWVEIRGEVAFAGEGARRRPVRARGVVADITGRKAAELQLAAELDAMTRLQNLGTLFVREGRLEPVLGEIVDTAIAIAGADSGCVQLVDPSTGDLQPAAHRGLPAWWVERCQTAGRSQGISGLALERGERVIVEDVGNSPVFAGTPALAMQLRVGIHAVQSTPLFDRAGLALGVFSTHARQPQRLDERALRLLDLLARQAADIIERARTEATLRSSETCLRLATDAAGMFAWECDLAAGTIRWSENAAHVIGCRHEALSEDLLQSHFFVAPEDAPRMSADFISAAARQETAYATEFRGRGEADAAKHFLMHARILYDAVGRPVRVLGVTQDITARKQVEQALASSELFYRQTLESIPGMVFTTRPDGWCDYQSQQWVEYTGVPMSEHLGQGWMQLLHPEDRPRAEAAWGAALNGRPLYDLEYRVRRRDGAYEWFRVIGRPIRDRAGRIVRWFGVAMNIHQLKEADEALRMADRRKDEFLATLAHELRNPLAPISNAVAILQLTGASGPTSQAALDMVERQVQHMTRLIDDLLDVSRITRGKLQLCKERVDLATVLLQAVEVALPLIDAAGHKLRIALPPQPVELDGDPVRLGQVFSNLLNNACHYTPRGGNITLGAECEGTEAVVTVEDTGIGIPPEHLPLVFEMFHQVPSDQRPPRCGLGIGLSLVRTIVKMHGGRVEARSDGDGAGSRFTVRLPVAAALPAAGTPAAEAPEEREVRGGRVLLADDNEDLAASLTTFLQLKHVDVRTARDGLEALAAAEGFQPDLVLLDLGMPRLDGYETCRRLRRQAGGGRLTIVAITGWGQESDRRKTREAGFDDHLVKPVAPAAILSLLAKVQDRRAAESSPEPTGCKRKQDAAPPAAAADAAQIPE